MKKRRIGWAPSHRLAAAAVLILGSAGVTEAQRTIPGYVRSDQSDVTGPTVTSGDQLAAMFTEPGTIYSMVCPVAWGVRTAADEVQMRLTSSNLQPALLVGNRTIGSAAQLSVLNLLMADSDNDAAREPVLAGLVANNGGAQRAARRLVAEAHGLFNVVARLDPLNPGDAAATRLSRAVAAYNGFVDASDESFLMSPRAEMTALHAALNHMVIASLENEGRPTETHVVDAAGLACAILPPPVPPTPAPTPPPPPPIEQAISICVLQDDVFRDVTAIRRPELGDTLVIVAGQRRPFAEVYPGVNDISSPPWVPAGEPVTIGATQYQPFGVSRAVDPGEITRRGEIQGFDYYAAPGDPATPPVIYFPVGPSCEVQPYRSVETIRVRG